MANINVSGTDSMVAEYLIYRGFTQTFQSLEYEQSKDRTKHFEVSRIVEAIFHNLQSYEIESFISLWDFLNKRFFFHMDAEHLQMCGMLKADLLKYYLINALKAKSKDKLIEFFTLYSHEILAESGNSIPGNLRGWFVLPYMDDPEKDPEFSVYFSTRWAELLKITLHNFLSVVLSAAPPPKLLLLERWFRSEAQQEIRTQLKLSARKIEVLLDRIESQEERLQNMREAIKVLVLHVHKLNNTTGTSGSSANGSNASGTSSTVGLFETDHEAEDRRIKSREAGQLALRTATDCTQKSLYIRTWSREEKLIALLGNKYAALFPNNRGSIAQTAFGDESLCGISLRGSSTKQQQNMMHGKPGIVGYEGSEGGSVAHAEDLEMLEERMVQQIHSWIGSVSST